MLLQQRRCGMDDAVVRFPTVARHFSLLQNVQTDLGSTQPPRQWVPGQRDRRCSSPISPFPVEVTNECSCTSTSPIRLRGVPRDNCTFTFSLRLSCRNDNERHELRDDGNNFWELDLPLNPASSNQGPTFAASQKKVQNEYRVGNWAHAECIANALLLW
jgi:hypothetical protein